MSAVDARNPQAGRSLERLIARYWEPAFYLAIVAVALALRLWDLDARGFQHDESRHVFYAWRLFRLEGDPGHPAYVHTPSLHGPFQYFATALMFRIFGDSDFTARLLYALFGTLLVGLPWLLRDALGRAGALLAALLLALSPTLLYFSRFARDDIITACATLALAIAIWRYLSDRTPGYLLLAAGALMLGVLTKEVVFASTAIFLLYLDWRLAGDLIEQLRSSRRLDQPQTTIAWAVFLPVAWLIAVLWPLLGPLRRRWSLSTLPPAGDLIVLIGTLVLLPLTPLVQRLPFVNDKGFYQDVPGAENTLFWGTLIPLACAAALVGLLWNRRLWPAAAAIVYVPYVSLYTTGFTNMAGFKSGMRGSLDLWERAQLTGGTNQLQYYYLMLSSAYEFLPIVFALGGALYYAYRGSSSQQLLTSGTLTAFALLLLIPGGDWRIELSVVLLLASVLLLSFDAFTKFLLLWTLLTLLSLTLANEKAPQLEVHLAVPLALLAAKMLDGIFAGSRDLFRASSLSPPSWPTTGRLAALALFVLLLAFSARSAFLAAYDQGDPDGTPAELFMELQSTPRLVDIRDQIANVSPDTTPCGRVTVVLDTAGFWPWPWYLRNDDYVVRNRAADFSPPAGAIVLIGIYDEEVMAPYLSDYQEGIRYQHYWTFPDAYRDLHAATFVRKALRGQYLDTLRDYFLRRGKTGVPSVLAFLPKQVSPQPNAADCHPPPPAPEPLNGEAAAFVTWANSNRPSVLPADGATELHLTGVDMFAQDLENTAVHLVGTTAREATCRTARDATRSGWAGYLRRIVANIPPVRLKPIQQGSDDDLDASAAIMRAACHWRDAASSASS